MADHQLTCAGCGAQFTYHRRKKYCTPKCRPGLRPKGTDRHENAACRQEHECKMCGVRFKPKRAGRTTCCSRECGVSYQAWVRSIKANGGRVTHTVRRRRCDQCGKPYTQRNGAVCCSDECRRVRQLEAIREASKAKHVAIERPCKECGKAFQPEYGTKMRVFCSEACGRKNIKRTARKKERARLRGAKVEAVNPTTVFNRDRWKCQHCGTRTPRKLRGSYNERAPELDHIVPLAQGGEHSYRNTQCLCRSCNGAKADGAGGQLRLFG